MSVPRYNSTEWGVWIGALLFFMIAVLILAPDPSPEQRYRDCVDEGNYPVTAQVDHDLDPVTPDTIIYVACEAAP